MRFWFSGEIHESVAEDYRAARTALEKALNRRCEHAIVSPAIEEIEYLAIILPQGWGGDYPEVTRYSKKDRSLECRLKIDCGVFACADQNGHFDLLHVSCADAKRG